MNTEPSFSPEHSPNHGLSFGNFKKKIADAQSIAELDRLMSTEWAWVKCTWEESRDLMRLFLARYEMLDVEGGCQGGRGVPEFVNEPVKEAA